ncbi:response regulator transcription factor [Paenibacillus illinoisensis]|uniref:response regulator transcription factor n=1 Tax=Paenibacillus illinoisensis TaxID=59845 RepID=UPI000FDBC66E|nr:response regulator transcription factor [Paenibacillus illinoisensis]
MNENILIVDDEKDIVALIHQTLTQEGYNVSTASSGTEALQLLGNPPDLILLDIMMPGMSGFELCRLIRDEVSCPILFLSARQAEMDRIQGLSIGGDDYMTKPFSLGELKARVAAHLRRSRRDGVQPHRNEPAFYRYGSLQMDLKGRTVMIMQHAIPLTLKEYDLVELLATHPGQVFSKEQLYDRIWGLEATGDTTTITEHVKKIRAKLAAADPDHAYISTVWGVGYKWEPVR